MTYTLLFAGAASFVFIALKAFQQLNVVHDQYLLVFPTSLLMAACEVFVIANIAMHGWSIPLWLAVGIGSGAGACFSMWLHKRMRNVRG